MSRLLDWLFNRSEDTPEKVAEDAARGLLQGEGPEDVAEVEDIDHDNC